MFLGPDSGFALSGSDPPSRWDRPTRASPSRARIRLRVGTARLGLRPRARIRLRVGTARLGLRPLGLGFAFALGPPDSGFALSGSDPPSCSDRPTRASPSRARIRLRVRTARLGLRPLGLGSAFVFGPPDSGFALSGSDPPSRWDRPTRASPSRARIRLRVRTARLGLRPLGPWARASASPAGGPRLASRGRCRRSRPGSQRPLRSSRRRGRACRAPSSRGC